MLWCRTLKLHICPWETTLTTVVGVGSAANHFTLTSPELITTQIKSSLQYVETWIYINSYSGKKKQMGSFTSMNSLPNHYTT